MIERAKKAVKNAESYREVAENLTNRSFEVKYNGPYTGPGTSASKIVKEAGYSVSTYNTDLGKLNHERAISPKGGFRASIERYEISESPISGTKRVNKDIKGVELRLRKSAGNSDYVIIAEDIKKTLEASKDKDKKTYPEGGHVF